MTASYPYEAKATLKYKAPPGSPDPISFQPGDSITVLSQADDEGDWLRGKTAAGDEGVFPASFVQQVAQSSTTVNDDQPEPVAEPAQSPTIAHEPTHELPPSSPATAAATTGAAPAAAPKPNAFKDRIAFLNQQSSAAPPPKPKPTFPKRAAVASPPPPTAAAAPELAPAAGTAETTKDTTESAGMSAADAAASISKGGSLRDRIAALQAQQAALAGESNKPTPPPKQGKVWKRPPAPPQPEPEEEEQALSPDARKPPSRSGSLLSPVAAADSSEEPSAESQAKEPEEVEQPTTSEPVELTEEESEAQRKEELRRRMATLSGSGGGSQMGMGVKMPALPKKTAGPQRRKKEAAPTPAATEPSSEAAEQSTPREADPVAPTTQESDPGSAVPPVSASLPISAAMKDDEEDDAHDGDDDDFETPSLPPSGSVLPPPLETAQDRDESESATEPTSAPSRPPVPVPTATHLETDKADVGPEEAEEDAATSPTRAMPPLPTGRPPVPSGPPPVPLMAPASLAQHDDEDEDRPLREPPPVPSSMPPPVPQSRPEEQVDDEQQELGDEAEEDEADKPSIRSPTSPIVPIPAAFPTSPMQARGSSTDDQSVTEPPTGTMSDAPAAQEEPAQEEEEEEDSEVARRRAIAARMAKLGGRAGPMMGMPPPFGAPMPPRKQRSVDPAEESAQDVPVAREAVTNDEPEDEQSLAAPARRAPGVPKGGILMPGFVPPVRRATEEDAPVREPEPTEAEQSRDRTSVEEAGWVPAAPMSPPPAPPSMVPPPVPTSRPPVPPPVAAEDEEDEEEEEVVEEQDETEPAASSAPSRGLPPPPPVMAGASSLSDEPESMHARDEQPIATPGTPKSRQSSSQMPPPISAGSPARRGSAQADAPLQKRQSIASVASSTRQRSMDVGRAPMDAGRTSMDAGRVSMDSNAASVAAGGPCKAAQGLDLMEATQWWTQQPFSAPSSISQRQDLTWEANVNKITKRGKTRYDNEIDVVFDDLSRTIVSVSFGEEDPSDADVSQESFAPPPYPSLDALIRLSTTLGAQIFAAAHSKLSEKARDVNAYQLIDLCFSRAPNALPPIAHSTFGIVVFATRGGSQKYEQDEPRAGDIVVFDNVKIKHGLSTTKVGQGARPHVAVVASWDVKKRKLHTIEAEGQVTEEGYRVEDVKSGEVKVFRVVDKAWLDTAAQL